VYAAVAAFVAFELGAGAVLVARNATRPPHVAAPRPSASAAARPSENRATALRANAVEALLARRAAAIRSRDRAAFAATLDSGDAAFVARQLAMFDALAAVPLSSWRYDVDAEGAAGSDDQRLRHYGTEAWAPRTTLRYQLAGFDDAPTAADQWLTFVRRGESWLVANDTDLDGTYGRRTARDLWDFGRVVVERGAHSLVLGHPGHTTLLRDIARQADAAVPRVTAVWGNGWSRRVVVVVPDTEHELAAILGDGTDLSRIAAVSVAELPGDTGNHPVGNRVIVNPPNFRKLGSNGRRVVVTHEVTHVATRDSSGEGVPTWLVEGFADYVGYLGTGLSARAICQELAADVRAGRLPAALPAETDFGGGNSRLAQAYEEGWLAVRLVAERVGPAGLVELYRVAGAAGGTHPEVTALRAVLHTTPEAFTAAWRSYVKQTLG
jgi:hypothetical protein